MEETKFKIETTDKREATLMLNAIRMAGVLYEFRNWRCAIYNGKNYDYSVLFNGKLYSYEEWHRDYDKITKDAERDENGFLKNYKQVYTENDVERRLNEYLNDVDDLIYTFYE